MTIAFAYLIFGLLLLTWSSDTFITGSVCIARYFGVSPMLIGLTIVSLGTSAPEIMVSVMAALHQQGDLAVANVIGSNIANIAFVLGLTVTVRPIQVKSNVLRREYPILAVITCALVFIFIDGYFARYEGFILCGLLLALISWFVLEAKQKRSTEQAQSEQVDPESLPMSKAVAYFLLGVVLLPLSAQLVVQGASQIAEALGVSSVLIGLTIVALGTSLPEAAASVAANLKGEADIAVGNVVGSNMLNIVAVLPCVALISPGTIDKNIIMRDMPIMVMLTIVLWALLYFGRNRISRVHGILLLLSYILYIAVLISGAIFS